MAGDISVVVFDVNETQSDLSPMAQRFGDVGAPPLLAQVWFAGLLRDGFALTAAGGKEAFGNIAESLLRGLLTDVDLDRDVNDAVRHILDGFLKLPVHPDVVDGVRSLRARRFRLVTLTNGASTVADRLLTAAGIKDQFEALHSVEDAPAWKPARAAYEFAARVCGTPVGEMLLVAVHPWDIHGAAAAGMATAWINRRGRHYPGYFAAPTHTVTALTELPARLGR